MLWEQKIIEIKREIIIGYIEFIYVTNLLVKIFAFSFNAFCRLFIA